MILEDFMSNYLYPGQHVEITGLGPTNSDNPIRYRGPQDTIPEDLLSETVERVTISRVDKHTLRIECEL